MEWKFLLAAALVVLLAMPSQAKVNDAEQAIDVVRGFAQAIAAVHEMGSLNNERMAVLGEALEKYVDFETTSARALGRHWDDASVDQRAKLTVGLRDYVTKNLVAYLVGPTAQPIETGTPANVLVSDETVVTARLVLASGRTRMLGFRLVRGAADEGLRIFDVIVSGVSTVELLSAQCRSIIGRDGVAGLLSRLAER
jgi:phospholipid transport system substrate-binding protein